MSNSVSRSDLCGRATRMRPVRSLSLLASTLALAFWFSIARAEPTPGATVNPRGPSTPGTAKRLPSLFTPDSITRVRGKIVRSTRGHPGAVRLEIERAEGGRLPVLVAPDNVVDSLGLSLRPGENVDVTGSLLAAQHPMLVATEFNVDGKQVRIRDEQGRLVKPPAAP